jgi:hypothetical protein
MCMSLMTGLVISGNIGVGWMMLLKWILNRLGHHGQNCFDPGYGQVAESFKHSNEPSVSINCEEFLHQLGNC